MIISGYISKFSYTPSKYALKEQLEEYKFNNFDINNSKSFGIISFPNKNRIAYSQWVTPKRTRSFPFSRIYSTYSFSGKKVTVIPVIKDEGLGERSNSSNNDRINFITLSWMNLANIFVILAYYDNAEKKSEYRITNQKMNNKHINNYLDKISSYESDAHQWNNTHFINDFSKIYESAVVCYEQISRNLNVKLNSSKNHIENLKSFKNTNGTIDLNKYAELTLSRSRGAATRESSTIHEQEFIQGTLTKPIFDITDSLGGRYFLTCDDTYVEKGVMKIIECKNSTQKKLPTKNDIHDGLFKLLLFSQIEDMVIDKKPITHTVELQITGKLIGDIELPSSEEEVKQYSIANNLSKSEENLLLYVNGEAKNNSISVKVYPNE
jgi:hypothetical protein